MNKYKAIYPEDILVTERERIKEVLASDTNDDAEKVAIVRGIMTLTDKLIQDDKEAE